MDLSRFFTSEYWFNLSPSTEIHNLKSWLIIFGAFSLFGVFTLINKFIYKKLRNKMAAFLLTIGLSGLILLSFRFEGVYLLSSRLFFLILAISALVWLIFLVIYMVKGYPEEMKAIAEYKRFSSYLPKKKKK